MIVIIGKVFSILAMVAVGFFLYRSGKLGDQARKDLTTLLLTVTTPCLSLYTLYEKELTRETMVSSAQAFIGCMGYILVASIVAFLFAKLIRTKVEDRGCFVVLMVALNNGFMGFPITKEIFGGDVLYLLVIHNIFMNIYFYSIAVMQMNSGRGFKLKEALRSLISPVLMAMALGLIMLAFGIRPPEMVDSLIRSLGDVTVPLSMIVVGLQLGPSNMKAILKNRQLILASLMTMIGIPLLTFCLTDLLPLYNEVKIVIIFSTVFPSAVIPVALAEQHGRNAKLIAEGVTLTTIMSLATIPVAASLLTAYYC
ncbi:MAG: AEC family transporter [Firmicutes bacterium]|nr:AEC family transporter [Bacillota bacterium]